MSNDQAAHRIRLLSYNIQSGLTTQRYSHYVTKVWKHIVPVPSRMHNLDGIAKLIADYDIVGLQEVDVGSLRSGFVDQAHYLADRARFDHFCEQTNRQIGRITRHSNVLLSRYKPHRFDDYKLPGAIKGRGALMASFGPGNPDDTLFLYVVHLALSGPARRQQMSYLAKRTRDQRHVILMGDLNCSSQSKELRWFEDLAGLAEPDTNLLTFPSWKPVRQLDHILISDSLRVRAMAAVDYSFSDHLPVEIELEVPACIRLEKAPPTTTPSRSV